jgi:hypothetical protein
MRRSKISQLPQAIREALDAKLVAGDFSDYSGIAEWLAEKGFEISRSSLHRHGSALEEQFKAAMEDARRTRALARAAREAGDDDGGELLSVASEIMQDNLVRASLKLKNQVSDPQETAKTLSMISRAFADMGRFDIARQKWQAEVRARVEAAAADIEKIARKDGLSQESLEVMRKKILEIVS